MSDLGVHVTLVFILASVVFLNWWVGITRKAVREELDAIWQALDEIDPPDAPEPDRP